MRALAPLFVMLATHTAAAADGRIVAVTVAPDHAVVTREVSAPCGPRQVLALVLPPAADPRTVRAATSTPDAVAIEGVRTQERSRADAFAAEAARLDRALDELGVELAGIDDAIAAAKVELDRGAKLGAFAEERLSHELVARAPDITA